MQQYKHIARHQTCADQNNKRITCLIGCSRSYHRSADRNDELGNLNASLNSHRTLYECADRNQKKAIKAIMVAIARLKTCADRNRHTQASMMLHVSISHVYERA